ncbi:MAG: mucoidy inhibitor MuiA family protein [Myxococcaceae bacterium]|nr:mucoidy inhibitor MuiA family protein [Myxococcaceae bacterium]
MLLLGLLGAGVLATAIEAPITSVTVYSDRARVVRTARLTVSGAQRVELPLLHGTVDASSLRVEAEGAELIRVDLRHVSTHALVPSEARKVLDALERLDAQLARNGAEREAVSAQLSALQGLRPTSAAEGEGDRASAPRLDPSGWNAATTFLLENTGKLQARLRELSLRAQELERERERQRQEASRLGSAPESPGLEVAPTLSGSGPVKLTLTYLTTSARWYPRYELQLLPEANRVQVSFFGLVSQETGEDWEDAALTLSTALPATATTLPRLATWKIGQRDRFIPTPAPLTVPLRPPPPVPPALPQEASESALLRRRLLALVEPPASPKPSPPVSSTAQRPPPQAAPSSLSGRSLSGTVTDASSRAPLADVVVTVRSPSLPEEQVVVTDSSGFYRFPQLPPGSFTVLFEAAGFSLYQTGAQLTGDRPTSLNAALVVETFAEEISIAAAPPSIDVGSTLSGLFRSSVPTETVGLGLAPPAAYRRPAVDPRLPASLAGGYDLAFPSTRPETVPSGGGERRIPLFTESWPVKAERKLFPALARNAFLVAELQSPSKQVLPGGEASLFVGADPAGMASLKLVAPGEKFTLPLGVDRAVRPVRNVKLVQSEKGFIGKDEETVYRVTIEVANPYAFPLPVRIHDQWPLTRDEDVEIKLLRTEPYARQDKVKGTLEWELTVPASGKTVVSFEYTLRHPKGWRMHQNP